MKRITAVIALWCFATACDDGGNRSPTNPTPNPTPSPVVQLSGLRIAGNTSLTSVGDTAQLTASVAFSDRTVKDVTADTQWSSSDPSVVTISATGLLTVQRFGASIISARYQNNYASLSVRPSPAGTFVIAGWVREPGAGGVVDVTVMDTATLSSAQTNSGGNYSLASLPRSEAHLRFERNGFEPAELDATQNEGDAALQRIIRLRAGDTISPPRFAPNDFGYTVRGDRCFPCRLVRLVSGVAGTFHLRVTWTEPRVTLSLWANGTVSTGSTSELEADVLVPAGESIVHLGMKPIPGATGYHVPFTIEASLR